MAILNGFGRSLGDGIIGLQALSVALDAGALPAQPVLFRLPGRPVVQQELYRAAEFCGLGALPWSEAAPGRPLDAAAGFARTIDLRDFALDPAFRGVALIDFFLARLGVAPETVASARKRNTWLAPRIAPPVPRAKAGALICPRASMALRDMPDAIEAAVGAYLDRRGLAARRQSPADSLAALCGQLAAAALVISTDTAMVHLADAFAVPCLAFFPTHRPEWRVRDYPLCRPIHLPASGLPEALEFSRGPADLAAARSAWFPHGDDLSWLHQALGSALDWPDVAARRTLCST